VCEKGKVRDFLEKKERLIMEMERRGGVQRTKIEKEEL
jgi:hypothetical protein